MAINIDDFKELLQDHMDGQPYKIQCAECGDELDCDAELDSDLDLKIAVHECKTCIENAYNEGLNDGV